MKRSLISCIALLVSISLTGQELSGHVVNERTGEGIPFASVYVMNVQLGTICDSSGYFAFTNSLPGKMTIRISVSLYETKYLEVERNQNINVLLKQSHLELEDVIVSAPNAGFAKNNAYRIDRLALKDLNAIPSATLSEAISNVNGVQMTSNGLGITKPVVRGLQGVRVLTMLNGMRIENQQWGGDHGMGIYQLGIEHVEVIKGPSSLLFGADAFGGVIYLIDAPYAKQGTQEIMVNSGFEDVNNGFSNAVSYNLSKGIFRLNLAGVNSSNADYRLPNQNYVYNTRYFDRGAKIGIGLSKSNWVMHTKYMLSNSRFGIPGDAEDSLISINNFQVTTQERGKSIPAQVFLNHFASIENKIFTGKSEYSLLVGFTSNSLSEYEEDSNDPSMNVRLNNHLYNLKHKIDLNNQWNIVSGFQGMFQLNQNDLNAEEELIPDFKQIDNGVYSIAYFNKGKWDAQLGLRYDVRILDSKNVSFSEVYSSPNFSIGAVHSNEKNTFRMNISSGFRAPHLSELLADGEHHGALRYEKGDVNLIPEYATQVDFSYELHHEHLELVLNPYYNYITNFIQIVKSDSMVEDLPLFQYQQFKEVQLYGLDIGIHYHPHFAHALHLESSYSFIVAQEINGHDLPLIPQNRLNSFVKINPHLSGKFIMDQLIIQHQYYFDQNRVSSFELPSPSYHLLNAGINFKYEAKQKLIIGLGVKNVLNENYINHLSQLRNVNIQHPGRSYYINLKINIEGKLKSKK